MNWADPLAYARHSNWQEITAQFDILMSDHIAWLKVMRKTFGHQGVKIIFTPSDNPYRIQTKAALMGKAAEKFLQECPRNKMRF